MYVGEQAAPNIEGAQDNLELAKQQAQREEDLMKIYETTGWHQGPEPGVWLHEVPDDNMKMTGDLEAGGGPVPLHKAIKHDELFQAAPGLKDTTVSAGDTSYPGALGEFRPEENHIAVGSANDKESLAHEIQHAVAQEQGMPDSYRGSSPDEAGSYEDYKNNPGEIMAEDTADRLNGANSDAPELAKEGAGR